MDEMRKNEARKRAERKLTNIIARNGDANGARLEPWYLNTLIAEELQQMECTERTKKIFLEVDKILGIPRGIKEKATSGIPQSCSDF